MSLMRTNGAWGDLRREIDRLFEGFFPIEREVAIDTSFNSVWAPAVDVAEDDKQYTLKAELPGLKRDDVNVELKDNVLSIHGDRKFEREDKKQNYHYVERSYGSFFRSFALPGVTDDSKVEAHFNDGLLTVSVAKAEQAKPKKIEIGEKPAVKTLKAGG